MKEKLCNFLAMCIGFAILVAILSSCAPSPLELTEKDNDSRASVARGQMIIITLESNITTGYTWEVKDVNSALLEQVGEAEYLAPASSATPALGAGGSQVFRFKSKASGPVVLRLVYHRPWEKDTPAAKTFTVVLEIK